VRAARGGAAADRAIADRSDDLRDAAFEALEQAYAPFSSFRVGAALLGSDGTVGLGCNIENAAFPASVCAERTAVGSLIVRGVRSFTMLVIATEADHPTPPCGFCRQVLAEFAPSLPIMSVTRSGAEARWTLDVLLPEPFTPHSMDRP
jgi:cytidine deaminase